MAENESETGKINKIFTKGCETVELNEKLQALRKERGLTQEELAQKLFVSRTAVSKWESGRGYPSIESLRAVARVFSVSVDDLLSGDAALKIAENEKRQREIRYDSLVFGLLDCSTAVFFFLPFFAQRTDGLVKEVSLLSLTGVEPYIKAMYFSVVFAMIICGVLLLALQNCKKTLWLCVKDKVSLSLSAVSAVLFTVGLQPYAAVFIFAFMIIKVLMLIKRA